MAASSTRSGSHSDTPRVDGRTARAARTREAIVDAMLRLLETGDLQPTAARIAAEAGISERLIYHHFSDLEALLGAVAERQTQRVVARLRPIDTTAPLPGRIDALVAQRADVFEFITPVQRASLLVEPFSPVLQEHRRRALDAARAQVRHVFASELGDLPAGERRERTAALDAALSWASWVHLRGGGLSVAVARRAVTRTVRGLLSDGR